MPIEIRPSGEAELYGMAGELVGEAKATEREIARAERIQTQLLSIQNQREMAAFNNQLLLDRMKFQATMGFEKEKRAEQWQLQKMEIASQIDFEREEGERQEKLNNYSAVVKKIDETDYLGEDTKERLKLQAYLKLHEVSVTDRALQPAQAKMGAPMAVSTLENEVRTVMNQISGASSYRHRIGFNISKEETMNFLEKRLIEFGWPNRNRAQKTQLFTTLDRQLKEDRQIEWTDNESEGLSELLGLIPRRETLQKILRQTNTKTGQERISYDGGKTWQTIG